MFWITLSNVLICLLYVLPGFVLRKASKASEEHLPTLSSLLVYALSPCMVISAFLSLDYDPRDLGSMLLFFAVSLALQIAFILALFLLLRKKYEQARYRILTCGSVMGNVGFFGLPLIKAILPEHPEAVCYATMFVLSMNLLIFTVGAFCVTGDIKYISLKAAVLNPTTIAILIGLPLYLLGAKAYLPELLTSAVDLLGKMTTPLCMIILGIRLASVPFRKLFARPFVYLIAAFKLLAFPLFCYLCVVFLPLAAPFKATVVLLAGTPCASVILNLAEMHRKETELAANCVMLTTLLCLFTLPLLSLLF